MSSVTGRGSDSNREDDAMYSLKSLDTNEKYFFQKVFPVKL